eukprot:5252208-Amphidinium_carterae.1
MDERAQSIEGWSAALKQGKLGMSAHSLPWSNIFILDQPAGIFFEALCGVAHKAHLLKTCSQLSTVGSGFVSPHLAAFSLPSAAGRSVGWQ